jgi:NitT/TauT family transport system substrate-binding protein
VVAPQSPIRTPLDLQGKTVGGTALGDISYLGLRAIIDARGGDSSTLHWVELPTSAVPAALQQGRIDAGLVTEPILSRAIKDGKVRFLLDMLGPPGYPRPILESAFFAMRDYVEKNHDAVSRFAAVLSQAAEYSNTHEAQTIPLFASLVQMNLRDAQEMHHTYTAPRFNLEEIQPVIDMAARYGTIPHGFDAREFVANLVRP